MISSIGRVSFTGKSNNDIFIFSKGGNKLEPLKKSEIGYFYQIPNVLAEGNSEARSFASMISWNASSKKKYTIEAGAKPLYILDKAGIYGENIVKFVKETCNFNLKLASTILDNVNKKKLSIEDLSNAVKANNGVDGFNKLFEIMTSKVKNVK